MSFLESLFKKSSSNRTVYKQEPLPIPKPVKIEPKFIEAKFVMKSKPLHVVPVVPVPIVPVVPVPVKQMRVPLGAVPTPINSSSGFSPNTETYTSLGSSYYQLAGDTVDLGRWAEYPAVTNVNINGFDIINSGVIGANQFIANFGGRVQTPTINVLRSGTTGGQIIMEDNTGVAYILESINSDLYFDGQLLAKANDIQNISDWALYPAIADVDMDLKGVSGASFVTTQTISSDGIFGTTGQYLTSDGVKLVWTDLPQISGPTGPTGATGATGPTGANGQSSSYFPYQADNGSSPTIGHITWSNFTNQLLSSYIRVNHINQDGVDVDIFLNLVQQGNTLIIQDANVSGNFQKWLVSGTPIPNTGSGYIQYPITLTASGGSSNFANNHQIILATIIPGPAGPAGPTGPAGSGADASLWANFPAVASVTIPDKDLVLTTSTPGIAYNSALLNGNVVVGSLGNAPLRPDFNAYVGSFNVGSIVSPASSVNITSIGNVSIAGGAGVSIDGGLGVSVLGGGGVSVVGTGAVSVAGGGISVNGGAVSLVGGSALTVAAGGVLVNGGGIAINGGGVAVNAGALTIASGTVGIGSLATIGGGLNNFGSDINMIPVLGATGTFRSELISSYSGTNTLAISGVSTINGSPYPPVNNVYRATYYKTAAQNLVTGPTDITFDGTGTWNNPGGYITHTNGTTIFTVGITGLYQMEFNALIFANGAIWDLLTNKNIAIDITRSPTAEQAVIANTSLQSSGQNYAQSVIGTYYLNSGDVINLRLVNTFTGGPPIVQPLQNTFDLNTFFTWRFIS